MVRIAGERFHVLPRVEGAEAGNEEIVRSVQMAAGLDDGFVEASESWVRNTSRTASRT
jgi:hypothetical protein